MQRLPDVLAYRSRMPPPLIPAKLIDPAVVNGAWKRLVTRVTELELLAEIVKLGDSLKPPVRSMHLATRT